MFKTSGIKIKLFESIASCKPTMISKEIEDHLPENFAKYFPSLFFFSEINQQTLDNFNSHCKNYYSKRLWKVNIKNIAKIYWF